jgi:hypothetical protein
MVKSWFENFEERMERFGRIYEHYFCVFSFFILLITLSNTEVGTYLHEHPRLEAESRRLCLGIQVTLYSTVGGKSIHGFFF